MTSRGKKAAQNKQSPAEENLSGLAKEARAVLRKWRDDASVRGPPTVRDVAREVFDPHVVGNKAPTYKAASGEAGGLASFLSRYPSTFVLVKDSAGGGGSNKRPDRPGFSLRTGEDEAVRVHLREDDYRKEPKKKNSASDEDLVESVASFLSKHPRGCHVSGICGVIFNPTGVGGARAATYKRISSSCGGLDKFLAKYPSVFKFVGGPGHVRLTGCSAVAGGGE